MTDLVPFQEPEYEVAPTPKPLSTVDERLAHIEEQNDLIIAGLNTIGGMLNQFSEGMEEAMKMVQQGGLKGIMSMLGGK